MDNLFNIDFSILGRIRDDIADVRADHLFLQDYCRELRQRQFDPQFFEETFDSFALWFDRYNVARDTRIAVEDYEEASGKPLKHKLKTAKKMLEAKNVCPESHPVEMARLLLEAKEKIAQCKEAIDSVPALIEERTAQLQKRVDELEARLAQFEDKVLNLPSSIQINAGAAGAMPAHRNERPMTEEQYAKELQKQHQRQINHEENHHAMIQLMGEAVYNCFKDKKIGMDFMLRLTVVNDLNDAFNVEAKEMLDKGLLTPKQITDSEFISAFHYLINSDVRKSHYTTERRLKDLAKAWASEHKEAEKSEEEDSTDSDLIEIE